MKPLLSVVSPVYGAEGTIDELVKQLVEVLETLDADYEIILVDDCGPDKSWDKIKQNSIIHSRVKGIKLSRNFGQHFAITAGIDHAQGDYVIVMDCDLQDDPKYIPVLFEKIREGYDIVYTLKNARKHSFFKNITATLFNKVFNYLIDNKSHRSNNNVGAYSIISKKVVQAFRSYNDYHRHYLSVLRWLGFKHCYIDIEHKERFEGKSSYTFSTLMVHALNGIVSQSDKLLRIFVTLGLSISLLSFLSILVIVFLYFVQGFLSGWASTIIIMLFSTGVILTGIGVLGIYLGKTFEQTKNRPKYVVDEKLNDELAKN
ncbi:MAG: glycosyltransferase [Bacteroidota bacterium]|jgi:dolichol-phosphate mannosyltransferase|nr:glycosyltransferase [Bacteroidota bacterium]